MLKAAKGQKINAERSKTAANHRCRTLIYYLTAPLLPYSALRNCGWGGSASTRFGSASGASRAPSSSILAPATSQVRRRRGEDEAPRASPRRRGAAVLRASPFWGAARVPPSKKPQINAERSNLAQNRCRTQQFGPESMQNAAIWPRIYAGRSNLAQNLCRTQQFGPESMQNAAIWPRIDAGRSKLAQNLCRTQQLCPESMRNAAIWPQSDAERSFSGE